MSSYTISIDLIADNQASGPVGDVQDSLSGLSKSQTDTANSTKQLAQETGKTNEIFSQFKNEITGLVTGLGAVEVLKKAGEFLALGSEVRNTSAVFTQLSGGAVQAAENLGLMQKATHFTATNLDLMSGANRLLLMGLAETGQEAASLTGIAVTLGRVMGKDTKESIEDFAALLANQSTPRLDNFAISSDRVRQRIDELKEAGMGAQEAFKFAVIEQGSLAIQRLGESASAAITPWDVLMTRITNGLEDIASRARTGFDALTGLAMYATGSLPQQQQMEQQATDAAQAFINSYYTNIQGFMTTKQPEIGSWDYSDLSEKQAQAYLSSIKTAFEGLGDLGGAATQADYDKLFGNLSIPVPDRQFFMESINWAIGEKDAQDALTATLREQGNVWGDVKGAMLAASSVSAVANPIGNMFGQLFGGQSAQQADVTRGMGASHAMDYWIGYGEMWQQYQQQQADAELQATWEKAREQGEAAQQIFNEFMAQGTAAPMTMGVGDQANAMKAQYEQMAADFEHLQEMNKDGLLSDQDLAKANDLMQSFKESADAVDRIAGMNLSELLGEGGGGVKGELSDKVINYMQEHDFSGAAIEQAKGAFDLSSGRTTEVSNFLDSDVIPMLAQLKPEEGAAAMSQVIDYLQKAEERGLTDAQKIDDLKTLMGQPGGQGQTFTIAPWQSPNFQAGIANNALNPAEMAKNMSIPGMSFTAADFSGMSGLSSNTQMTYEQLEPIIKQNLLENIRKQYTSESGVQVRSDSDIQSDPAFQQMVKDLTAKGLAQANAAVSQISGTGYTTASAAAAGLHVDQGQVLAAAGVSDPRMLQPGTYTLGGYGFNPNFDVNSLFADQGAGMAGAGPTDMTQNLKDMVEPAQQVSGSMTEVQDSTKEIGANLDTVRESLDSLSKGTHKIQVELAITNLDFINSLVVGQGVAAGGGGRTKPVRDQGGTVKGMDARTLD